ncbi:MAG: hypothetical protein DI529_17145 [Chryseobacterium sp.]|nr:MAG: hypothetical protein DI529_17145 [Chryseobacterium sp.]
MNQDFDKKKIELLQWIADLQDESLISKLLEIKNNSGVSSTINAAKAEYLVKDDFEERWAKGLTKEESIERTKSKIREWWGK